MLLKNRSFAVQRSPLRQSRVGRVVHANQIEAFRDLPC